jgi:glycosyltransferase involved in cell wall biosynthesis
VSENRWVKVNNADVLYLSPGWSGLFKMIALLRSLDRRSVLYLNGVFSRRFSMLPVFLQWLRLTSFAQVVLVPRGEFSPGALNLKRRRKALYLTMARWLGLYRDVIWHATSEFEAEAIKLVFPGSRRICVAKMIPTATGDHREENSSCGAAGEDQAQSQEPSAAGKAPFHAGRLRIVFVSRISRKKNLIGALRMLEGISGKIEFDIYGPAEDARYWDECQRVIASLPSNVHVKYWGAVEPEKVSKIFAESDLFLFPTLGENYGHVICEALAAGCPVLISDQTPWLNLEEKKAGWVIPLGETERFRAILQQCVDADDEWHAALTAGAKAFAREFLSVPKIIHANRMLFRFATGGQEASEFNP